MPSGSCEVNVRASPFEVWPKETGSDQTIATVMVSLTTPPPPQGCAVNLKIEPVEHSGGHSHDGSRPKGAVDKESIHFEAMGAQNVIYTSSKVAGEEKIIAEVNGEVKSEATIKVKVPGLEPLWSSIVYNLTGSTSSHPSNHYGTSDINNKIYNVAFDYVYETDTILGINDMSLVWGGLFDIDGDWLPPHNWHRKGKSVDIDRNVYDINKEKYILIPCEKDKLLREVVEEWYKADLICESGGRKHIEFP